MYFLVFMLFSHELLHKIETSRHAVVVEFYFADNSKFSYESYKVFRPGDSKIPFAVGRTDALGRVVFLPDTEGTWVVKTQSETGHGAVVSIDVDKNLITLEKNNTMLFNIIRFLIGLLVIFGVFFLLSKNTKKQPKKEA